MVANELTLRDQQEKWYRPAKGSRQLRIAFGSKLVTGGFQIWTTETRLTEGMKTMVGAIFAFDGSSKIQTRKLLKPLIA